MKPLHAPSPSFVRTSLLALGLSAAIFALKPAQAALVELATAPLATSTTSTVKPNLMFILDDSGSMSYTYMPDSADIFRGKLGYNSSHCNEVYYNPDITYVPPVDSNGTVYPNASFTAARDNGFDPNSTVRNLDNKDGKGEFIANRFSPEEANSKFKIYGSYKLESLGPYSAHYNNYSGSQTTKNYLDSSSAFYRECSTGFADNGSNVFTRIILWSSTKDTKAMIVVSGGSSTSVRSIKVNGIQEIMAGTTIASGKSSTVARRIAKQINLCTSAKVGNCTTTGGHGYTATPSGNVVWITGLADTTKTMIITKGNAGTMSLFPNIYLAADSSKLTNFANWYSYYRTRMLTMKTATGRAFTNIGNTYRVGLMKINQTDPVVNVDTFEGSHRDNWYTQLYGVSPLVANTPLPRSLSDAGRYFAGKLGGTDPVQYSCQQNFTILSTDGLWTSSDSYRVDGSTAIGNQDGTAGRPMYDGTGSTGGSSDSLADVAMYYYQTDLRTPALGNCTGAIAGENVCTNNVFSSSTDNNTQQHMTTFTLGLGVNGKMKYSPSYLTDTSGDFFSVKMGSRAGPGVCTWQRPDTVCNWPIPGDNKLENIDDLWHAAVNGRGVYFSATDPSSLATGLSNALAAINARRGAGSAAASSTLNPVAGNNFAFVASYTTMSWKGNLEARGINTYTGAISKNATWCVENVVADTCAAPGEIVAENDGNTTAYFCVRHNSNQASCPDGVLDGTDCKVPVATTCTGTMNAKVAADSDTRIIKTANSSGTGLVDFTYDNLTAKQQGYFSSATISGLSQWATMSEAQKTAATGANLVNFLRGQYAFEDRTSNPAENRIFRFREAVLGDVLESRPTFISKPVFSYPYPGYSNYVTAQAGRAGTVYVGANDGMMHAFAADTGIERWAYVPSMVIPNMWKLADINYATLHTNYVNGSPSISDVCVANCTDAATAVWKTILVAGLGGGGRGYYALDITDPNAPALMWEMTTTDGIGKVKDDDVGYAFGHPIITRKNDGTWVVLVTSGYNNTSPGDGKGYLYVLDAASGAILSKISTGVGDTTTPSGLSQITAWNNEPSGNLAGYVYGGDLLGNLWRFDINTDSVMQFATLYSDEAGTNPQPITTAPALGTIAGKRVIFVGTGKYLEISDLTTTQTQSIYAIKDDDATATLVNPRNTLVRQTLSNNSDGSTRSSSGNTVNFNSRRGWYVDLPDTGERVNINPQLVQGTLIVATLVPSNTVCSPGGHGWLNFLDYKTGGAVDVTTYLSSMKSDSPIAGFSTFFIDGEAKMAAVDTTGEIDVDDGIFRSNAARFTGKRVLWRELIN